MAIFYLVRHGNNDWVGKRMAGWLPGVHLNEEGRGQAERLARHLAGSGINRIVSSPLDRAQETAAPLAARLGVEVETSKEFIEIGFGDWTGKTIEELERDPLWQQYTEKRAITRAPGGEMMIETQMRAVTGIERLRAERGDSAITAVVSHADTIRSIVLYYLGMPIDFFQRLEIRPGSFTVIEVSNSGPRILRFNERPD